MDTGPALVLAIGGIFAFLVSLLPLAQAVWERGRPGAQEPKSEEEEDAAHSAPKPVVILPHPRLTAVLWSFGATVLLAHQVYVGLTGALVVQTALLVAAANALLAMLVVTETRTRENKFNLPPVIAPYAEPVAALIVFCVFSGLLAGFFVFLLTALDDSMEVACCVLTSLAIASSFVPFWNWLCRHSSRDPSGGVMLWVSAAGFVGGGAAVGTVLVSDLGVRRNVELVIPPALFLTCWVVTFIISMNHRWCRKVTGLITTESLRGDFGASMSDLNRRPRPDDATDANVLERRKDAVEAPRANDGSAVEADSAQSRA